MPYKDFALSFLVLGKISCPKNACFIKNFRPHFRARCGVHGCPEQTYYPRIWVGVVTYLFRIPRQRGIDPCSLNNPGLGFGRENGRFLAQLFY